MSDYTEIELRVAKAMFDVEALEDGYPYPWENTSTSRQDRWLARARNALNALRLPISEDMAHAAVQLGIADEMDCAIIFKAMIDAASPISGSGGDNRT